MDTSGITFESALKRLEEIVKLLEQENITLDETIKLYEEGMKLSDFCMKRLTEAENKIMVIKQKDKGIELEDFNLRRE